MTVMRIVYVQVESAVGTLEFANCNLKIAIVRVILNV